MKKPLALSLLTASVAARQVSPSAPDAEVDAPVSPSASSAEVEAPVSPSAPDAAPDGGLIVADPGLDQVRLVPKEAP